MDYLETLKELLNETTEDENIRPKEKNEIIKTLNQLIVIFKLLKAMDHQ